MGHECKASVVRCQWFNPLTATDYRLLTTDAQLAAFSSAGRGQAWQICYVCTIDDCDYLRDRDYLFQDACSSECLRAASAMRELAASKIAPASSATAPVANRSS